MKVRDEVVEEFLCAKAGKGDVELGRRRAKRWQVGGVKSDPSCRCRQEDVNVGSVRSCSRWLLRILWTSCVGLVMYVS